MVEGQPITEKGTGFAFAAIGTGAVIALLDRRAFRPVALPQLAFPGGGYLLGDHRMVKAAIIAGDEAAQRIRAVLAERPQVSAQPTQLRQHRVVVRQRPGGQLVPRRRPEQHRVPAPLRIALRRKVAVAQASDMQRHEREVLQVRVR